jgi:toxic protein SymE
MLSGTRTKALRRGKMHGQYWASGNHWNRGRNVPWLNVQGL